MVIASDCYPNMPFISDRCVCRVESEPSEIGQQTLDPSVCCGLGRLFAVDPADVHVSRNVARRYAP